jgi:predicted metal-dependent hydrolase
VRERLPSPFVADRPALDHALPETRHVPGTGTTPELGLLEEVKVLAPPRTDVEAWRENVPYLYGMALFEAGFYWEAHEIWEPVWMNCAPNSPERHLLQALIQYANAALKRAMGRARATRRLIEDCSKHLGRVPRTSGQGVLMGVDVVRWLALLAEQIAAMDAL